ncbi:MAG: ATP-binding cassette domain-containing protein [Pseudomonadota bacterium]|nr:MAG: ATP-binding cassette domain-containing protein [Pseudomonadota bacterium]
MTQDTLVSVEHLTRHYGPLTAVDNIAFELARGEVLGFLGPNGAGKSTTMQMLTGNLAPSAGRISICGLDLLDSPKAAKAQIGYLPEQPPLYLEFTVDEYLRFCARLNRIANDQVTQAVERARERCGLQQVGNRLIGNLSKGFRQRVGIAQAIIHSPSVVILDEPTVGLDPIQIREIRALIRELGTEHSVILSTHILPEVQMTCDRVQIINRGKLVFSDSVQHLSQRMESSSLVVGFRNPPSGDALGALPGVTAVEALSGQRLRISHSVDQDPTDALVEHAVNSGWQLTELTPEYKTLEQIFVDITATEYETEAGEAA